MAEFPHFSSLARLLQYLLRPRDDPEGQWETPRRPTSCMPSKPRTACSPPLSRSSFRPRSSPMRSCLPAPALWP